MSWFVELQMREGGTIHVRPEMVKAVYAVKRGTWVGTNVVVDGHDFDIEGTPEEVMNAVQFDIHAESV